MHIFVYPGLTRVLSKTVGANTNDRQGDNEFGPICRYIYRYIDVSYIWMMIDIFIYRLNRFSRPFISFC